MKQRRKAVGIMERIIKAVVAGILTAVLALLSKDGNEE